MTVMKGACKGCKKECTAQTGTNHIAKCKEVAGRFVSATAQNSEKAYLIKVLGATYHGTYWMFLLAPFTSSLGELDLFLREIWLECCGHLSLFRIGDVRYSAHVEDIGGESINVTLGDVLSDKLTFRYEYDFGSTTELVLQVVGILDNCLAKSIIVVSKNDVTEVPCELCPRVSKYICSFCFIVFCTKGCSKKHDCVRNERGDTYMISNLRNSPRSGVCGY